MACCESSGGMKKYPKLNDKRESDDEKPKKTKELREDHENLGDKTKRTKPKTKKRKPSGSHRGYTVWYDKDTTPCDRRSMKIIKESANLAIDVFNKTHPTKYSFLEPLHATGYLFAGFMLNMMFTAKPKDDEDDKNAKTFRARVNIVHNYVDYVEFVPPEDLL